MAEHCETLVGPDPIASQSQQRPLGKQKKTVAELHLTYLNGRPSIGSANTANKKNKYSTSRPRTEI